MRRALRVDELGVGQGFGLACLNLVCFGLGCLGR